jgi:hypothetical protein
MDQPHSSGNSVEMITSVAFITATALLPFLSFSRFADDALIKETISFPPPMSITTSDITDPVFTEITVPLNWLRALSAMSAGLSPNASNPQ